VIFLLIEFPGRFFHNDAALKTPYRSRPVNRPPQERSFVA
jgi:hypothetical protein